MQTASGRDRKSLELLGLLNLAVLTEAMADVDGELSTASVTAALKAFSDRDVPGLAVPVTFTTDRHIAAAATIYQADPATTGWISVAEVAAPTSLQ